MIPTCRIFQPKPASDVDVCPPPYERRTLPHPDRSTQAQDHIPGTETSRPPCDRLRDKTRIGGDRIHERPGDQTVSGLDTNKRWPPLAQRFPKVDPRREHAVAQAFAVSIASFICRWVSTYTSLIEEPGKMSWN